VRLLVVEDDDIVADAITRGLAAANYAVHRVTSAESPSRTRGRGICPRGHSVGLPGSDGLTLVRPAQFGQNAADAHPDGPLHAGRQVKALDLGADDFMASRLKPPSWRQDAEPSCAAPAARWTASSNSTD